MTIVNNNESNHANCNYRNSDFRHKRESTYYDENENTLNFVATPLTNNASNDDSMKATAFNNPPTAGKLFFKLAVNTRGEH